MAFTDITEANQTTYIRTLMNKPTETDVLDTDIVSWIDEANLLIASQGRIYEEESIELQYSGASTGKYEFSLGEGGDLVIDDYAAIRGVLHHGATQDLPAGDLVALSKIHIRQISHLRVGTAVGEPRYWYIRESTLTNGIPLAYLGIWPPPDAAAEYLKILYYKFNNDYDTTGTINCPDYLQDLIRWYALSKWFERDGKYAQADQYRSYFDNLLMYYRRLRESNQSNMDSKNSLTEPDRTKVV